MRRATSAGPSACRAGRPAVEPVETEGDVVRHGGTRYLCEIPGVEDEQVRGASGCVEYNREQYAIVLVSRTGTPDEHRLTRIGALVLPVETPFARDVELHDLVYEAAAARVLDADAVDVAIVAAVDPCVVGARELEVPLDQV